MQYENHLPHPFLPIPLPDHPCITPFTHTDLLLGTPEDRRAFVTDITLAGHHPDPLEIVMVQEPGNRINPERFLTFHTGYSLLHVFANAGGE